LRIRLEDSTMKLTNYLFMLAPALALPAVAMADDCLPSTYAVSGTVTTNTGANLGGVVIRDGSSSTRSKGNGAYAVVNLSNGTYTITPSLSGYSFSPATRTVTVNGAAVAGQNFVGTPSANANPVAGFTFNVSGLLATFTDTSTDADGTIASRLWGFGDGTTSNVLNPSHTYGTAGSYTVVLTVTDNAGATNTLSKQVAVGNVLANGVTVPNLSAATGDSVDYVMTVPAGATNLQFATGGGTGDADLYVKFGSVPTDSSYDCRPYTNGSTETCSFAAPTAGTYYVRVKAYSAFSGLSLTGSYTPPGTAQTYSNTTDYTISDNATVDSPITVSGRSGNCPANASVSVAIVHTYIGDIKVDLVAPDGTLYNVHNRTGASTDNINKAVTFDLSSEAMNGTWNLRVNDNATQDTGKIDSWSITF